MFYRVTKIIIFIGLFVSTTVEAASAWELSKKAEGINVYVRSELNTEFKSFKGVMTIPARLTSVIAVLDDTKVFPRLFHNCTSAKSLKKIGNNEKINHVVTGLPWPVNPRDSITHSVLHQDEKTKKIIITINSKPKMLPQKKGTIRVQHLNGRWELTPLGEGKVKIVYELSVVPGGKIPVWLVNLLVVDTPFYTLSNLRKLVQEPNYKNAKLSHIVD